MRLLPYLFLELAPFYVAKYDAAPEAVSYEHAPFYVTNLAVPFFVKRAEKDELQCLSTLCGRDQCSKIVSKRFPSQVLAFYLAETRHYHDK